MFEIRTILLRLRNGDSDRRISKAGLAGRHKAGEIRQWAQANDWLDTSKPLPDNETLAQMLATPAVAVLPGKSFLEPYREQV